MNYYSVDVSDENLEHHGVKGMRWGVRNDIRRVGRALKKGAKKSYHAVRRTASAVRSFKNRRAIKSGNRVRIAKRLNKMSNAELAEVITNMDLKNHAMSSLSGGGSNSNAVNKGNSVVKQIVTNAAKQSVQRLTNEAFDSALRGENPITSYAQNAQLRSNQNEIKYLQSQKTLKSLRYDLGYDSKVRKIYTTSGGTKLSKTRKLKK